jgi:phosphoglycolate phosphatase-like HAD superfamily hydrolase
MTVSPPAAEKQQIYCDLDGVLVNFHGFVRDELGITMKAADDPEAWAKIGEYVKSGHDFFNVMEPLSGADELWERIEPSTPIILTSVTTDPAFGDVAKQQKTEWVRQYLGDQYADTILFVETPCAKSEYAEPGAILIDDTEQAIQCWADRHGIGIHYKTIAGVLNQLQQYGI